MTIPIYTSYEDLTAVVDYLKTKATGVPLKEARTVVDPKRLDGRKISSFQTWGFITKDTDRLNLTAQGRDFARLDAAGRSKALWSFLSAVPYYRTILEWLHHSKATSVTNVEVAARWHDHSKEEVGTGNENTLKDGAVTFLGLAQAAGLGTFTFGRHGKPTRFDPNGAALAEFVGLPAPPATPSLDAYTDGAPSGRDEAPPPPPPPGRSRPIFVGHGKNHEPVEALKKILNQFQVPYLVAEDEPHGGRPISKKVADLMQKCGSAIFVFTCDEQTTDAKGNVVWRPRDNTVYELGAATVLYDGRVVIFREQGVDFASDFSDFGHITFEKGNIEAKSVDLLKELVEFKLLKFMAA
ncbi:MAG TPA: TIR domain-containing protein [Thermoplasmata archaeon]|nr:TIR domain-containing protein [Thermoplasmata archaeon]